MATIAKAANKKRGIMSEKELRELDAWIAEHVMGWVRASEIENAREGKSFFAGQTRTWARIGKPFSPTTDPAAAMQVMERCIHTDDVVIYKTVNEKYGVRSDITDMAIDAETLPLAICLFAKKLFSKPPVKQQVEEKV